MYFWNIEQLKIDLQMAKVTERSTLHYLIAHFIIYGIAAIPLQHANQLDIISALLMLLVSLLGINYAYHCNGGDSGKQFLTKYMALSWVVTIRMMVMVAPVLLLLDAISKLMSDWHIGVPLAHSHPTHLSDVLLMTSLAAVFFWRIAVHIGDTVHSKVPQFYRAKA